MDVSEEAFYNFWSIPVFELFLGSIRANMKNGATGLLQLNHLFSLHSL